MNSPDTSTAANPTVPADTLAKLFNLTTVRIHQLVKAGVLVKPERGRFDLWASIRGYIKFLQDRAMGRGGGSPDDEYHKERVRLTRARADSAEVEAALCKGTAHPADVVAAIWSDMIANARAKILSIPVKAAPQVHQLDDLPRIKSIIEEYCHESLNELAAYDPSRIVEKFIQEHQQRVDPSTEVDDQSVV